MFTRRLLRLDGSTTELLEERLGRRLRLFVTAQSTAAAPPSASGRVPGGSRRLHEPHADEPYLIRRSELIGPRGMVVSRNLVTGRLPGDPRLAGAVTGRTVPLGVSAAVRCAAPRRVPLEIALCPWPGSAPAVSAVRRVYLLSLADEAPLYVEERFNPAVVPSVRTARTPRPPR
ncbi:hypothetical protein [Streptomyces verrucosisporus]|uniref:hypothetical protein n=1 Tax=Streptomyces verrucosisporus TaxID=1695161 RepID=UPI0027D9E361|nr:hypothetical protein [Streptomyces verrucosisporus]